MSVCCAKGRRAYQAQVLVDTVLACPPVDCINTIYESMAVVDMGRQLIAMQV
jgi:hypothetical protein